jgi:predicted MFS family arabinose efflux permease
MTTSMSVTTAPPPPISASPAAAATAGAAVARRLRPLRLVMLLDGVALWVPVEKLFMTQLGFDTARIAAMAAAYAAVVPLLEIPSGILADRWSRRGVLLVAKTAALLSVVVGALSHNVPSYILSAMLLGVYLGLQSGIVDTIVYDLLLEELGDGASFERRYGRLHLVNSVALTLSALAGGLIAAVASPRWCYLVTIPFAAAAVPVLLRLREPTLHRTGQTQTSLTRQLATTYRAVAHRGGLIPVVAATALGSTILQMLFEFGPLWLFAVGAPTLILGPYTAGMTSASGLGGLLAGRSLFNRPATTAATVTLLGGCGLLLPVARTPVVAVAVQILLAVLLVATGIYLGRVLHDAVPSAIRSSLSSAVGTVSWLTFLPAAALFGWISHRAGVSAAGWILAALTGVLAATVAGVARREHRPAQPHSRSICQPACQPAMS